MEHWSPQRRRHPFQPRSHRLKFGRFWRQRLYDHDQLDKQRRVVYTLLLFMVFLRIGSVIFAYFEIPPREFLPNISWQHDLPRANSLDRFSFSRNLVVISIDKTGIVRFNGQVLEQSQWVEVLDGLKRNPEHPADRVALMVDRECEMSRVYEVFAVLQRTSILNVFFVARPITPSPGPDFKFWEPANASWLSISLFALLIVLLVLQRAQRKKARRYSNGLIPQRTLWSDRKVK